VIDPLVVCTSVNVIASSLHFKPKHFSSASQILLDPQTQIHSSTFQPCHLHNHHNFPYKILYTTREAVTGSSIASSLDEGTNFTYFESSSIDSLPIICDKIVREEKGDVCIGCGGS